MIPPTDSTASPAAIVQPRLTFWAKLNIAGLVLAAAGMLTQMAFGSQLYPTLTGPTVLLIAALIVAFGPARWVPFVALLVPLVFGVGALIAASMTGGFVAQLTSLGQPGLFIGSLMHVIGLVAAIVGGAGMLRDRRTAGLAWARS